MHTTKYTDVLVIGAGPAGLMAAICLSSLNVQVKIIDKRLPNETAGRADGLQPRTIEIWESLGMAEELKRNGIHTYRLVTYQPNKEGTGIQMSKQAQNVSAPSARYPFEIILHPESIERIMTETLTGRQVEIQQPSIPQVLQLSDTHDTHSEYPIKVTCANLNVQSLQHVSMDARDGLAQNSEYVQHTEIIRAKYVIGCDGAHSWVRRQCGIRMEGSQHGLTWGVMDFTPLTDFPTPLAKSVIQSPLTGILGCVPRPNNTIRVYTVLQDNIHAEDEKESSKDIASVMSEVIGRGFLPYKMLTKDISWCSRYSVIQRIASSFSVNNRIFIAGDACHVHSPNAGQGVNVSMSDAYNLAWKLAYAIHGLGNPNILDTYESERRPCSIELMDLDRDLQKLHHPETLYPEEYVRLMQHRNMFTTGIGLEYRSRLTVTGFQELAVGLSIGQRLPPGDILRCCDWNPRNLHDIIPYSLTFKLLLFPGKIMVQDVHQKFIRFVNKLDSILHDRERALVEVSAILYVNKDELSYDFNSLSLLPDTRIFIDDKITTEGLDLSGVVYRSLGISKDVGVGVLVRPDGHIALLSPIADEGLDWIHNYVKSL